MNEILVFLFIVLGCLFRTLSPFMRKLQKAKEANEKFKWNHKYTFIFINSVLVAFISALIGFSGFQIPVDPISTLALLSTAFGYGVGLNSLINEVAGWLKK